MLNVAIGGDSTSNVPATSVPSERVFSKAGQVLTQRRSRLTTSKVEKIIFIQANL